MSNIYITEKTAFFFFLLYSNGHIIHHFPNGKCLIKNKKQNVPLCVAVPIQVSVTPTMCSLSLTVQVQNNPMLEIGAVFSRVY